jgi:GDP/UDP-N,N'-diacetylbacillosamine 2-epimerase (hydrolysing)
MADSIIQAEPTRESIKKAFDKLYSKEFQDLMKSDYKVYYKGGNVAEKILKIIKQKMPLDTKKGFYDIKGGECLEEL